MDERRTAIVVTAATLLLSMAGCGDRPLDPAGSDPGVGASAAPPADTAAALRALAGPNSLLVVGSNAGVVGRTPSGQVQYFAQDPGALVQAAGSANMPVCSIEMQDLAMPASAPGGTAGSGLAVDAALTQCDQDDLGDMLDRLRGLQTPNTVVIVAANGAITARSTNGGINFFYDDDRFRLLRAARKLYVTACAIVPQDLAIPTYPEGQTAGVSIDDAVAACAQPQP
jgi:hypothetical protein